MSIALQITEWKKLDHNSPGWLSVSQLDEILKDNNGSQQVPAEFYSPIVYADMRHHMALNLTIGKTFPGLIALQRIHGPDDMDYSVLSFDTMENLNAFRAGIDGMETFEAYKAARTAMLDLLKIQMTVHEPILVDHEKAWLKSIAETEILEVLTG